MLGAWPSLQGPGYRALRNSGRRQAPETGGRALHHDLPIRGRSNTSRGQGLAEAFCMSTPSEHVGLRSGLAWAWCFALLPQDHKD